MLSTLNRVRSTGLWDIYLRERDIYLRERDIYLRERDIYLRERYICLLEMRLFARPASFKVIWISSDLIASSLTDLNQRIWRSCNVITLRMRLGGQLDLSIRFGYVLALLRKMRLGEQLDGSMTFGYVLPIWSTWRVGVWGTPDERWGAGVETQKNVRGEVGGWGRVPFNEPYAPSLKTIYDGA